MNTLPERLYSLMAVKGLSACDLAAKIDEPIELVNSWLDSTAAPSDADYKSLGLLFSCSGAWLAAGTGLTPAVLCSASSSKAHAASALPAPEKHRTASVHNLNPSPITAVPTSTDLRIRYLDLTPHNCDAFNVHAPAFTDSVVTLPHAFASPFLTKAVKHGSLAAMYAFDYKMVPTFSEGDTLVIDLSQNQISGYGVYVYTTPAGLAVSRFCYVGQGMLVMSYENDKGKGYEVTQDEVQRMNVIGRVLTAIQLREI